MFWFVGGTDPQKYAEAEKAGRLNELPSNHSPQFAPVINPTLRVGIEAMLAAAGPWLARGRKALNCLVLIRLEVSTLAVTVDRTHQRSLHPLHAVLLAGTVPLFLGVLLSDIAYSSSYEMQWKNFASWLIVGGLVFGGFALLWALIELFRADQRGRRPSFTFFFCWRPGSWASSTR